MVRRPNDKSQAEIRHLRPILRDGVVDFWRRRSIEMHLPNVAHHPDNRAASGLCTDRISVSKISTGQRFIDHYHRRSVPRVSCREDAASSNGDAEGLKI